VAREVKRYGSVDKALDVMFPLLPRGGWTWAYQRANVHRGMLNILIVALAWPWLTLATLMIFRTSMKRAMVKRGHVLRCTLYGCDWTLWLGWLASLIVTEHFAVRWMPYFYPLASMPMLAASLFATYTGYRLGCAYSRYLKFDRPYATVAAAQIVVFLFVAAVCVLAFNR
jgi:hypothetical protein